MSAAHDGTRRRICNQCSYLWRPKGWRNYRCPNCGAWDDELRKQMLKGKNGGCELVRMDTTCPRCVTSRDAKCGRCGVCLYCCRCQPRRRRPAKHQRAKHGGRR